MAPSQSSAAVDNADASYESRRVRRWVTSLGLTVPIVNTGLSAHLAISTDGTHLAYALQRPQGTQQLHVRALDQLQDLPISETDGAAHPFFSADGEWIFFYSDQSDGRLKKVPVKGGGVQELAVAPWAAGGSWATNDSVIFSTRDSGLDRSIFTLSTSGRDEPEVLIPSDTENGYIWPDVLPNGKGVLYSERPRGGTASGGRIQVLSLATGESHVLVEGAYRPTYVTTGHIVFVRSASLWAVPFDAERLETTGRETLLIDGVQSDSVLGGVAYAVAGDGTLAYIPGGDVTGLRKMVWLDRNGEELSLDVEDRTYLHMKISPDGERVAAAITDKGSNDIWIVDLNRGTSDRLTTHPGADLSPLWTPDGQRIVFASGRDGNGLYWMATDGTGTVERLTESESRQWPESFSPDGKSLVFREDGGELGSDLFLLSNVATEERNVEPLLRTQFSEGLATISPDGNWMAYRSNRTGQSEIYVRPFPDVQNGPSYRISTNGGTEPRWVNGGRELVYLTNNNAPTIMAVAVNTEDGFEPQTPRALVGLINGWVANTTSGYDASDDGQRFLTLKTVDSTGNTDSDTRLVVVENWATELRRLVPAR